MRNSPSDWLVIQNDGVILVARNQVTNELFSGTPQAFRSRFTTVVELRQLFIGSDRRLYDETMSLVDVVEVTGFSTVSVSTSAAVTLKAGPCFLKSFTVIAKGISPLLDLWNNTSASGEKLIPQLNGSTPVGDFPALNIGETYTWDEPLFCSNGLQVLIGGTGTTTIQFQVK